MRYRFGPFELDADLGELRLGTGLKHLEPRVLDLLTYLVRHRDRIVSRDELFDGVWKTRFVGESALSRAILQLRKALTHEEVSGEAVKTLQRRGYRFVLAVDELAPAAPAAPQAARMTLDADADRLCRRAQELCKQRLPESMRQAVVLLREALAIDPGHADAYATLADCYGFIGFLQQTPPMSVFPKAEEAIARALALDPDLPVAHACRGFVETVYRCNPAAADQALAQALRLDDRLAIGHHRLGLLRLAQRRFDDADAALQRASELDPLSPILATACGLPAMARGDPRAAIAVYRTVIESEPGFFPARLYLGLALERLGALDEAIEVLQQAVAMTPTETEAMPALAHALARGGRQGDAEGIAAHLHQAAARRFISPFFFAVLAMGLNDHATALRRLQEAAAMRAMRLHDLHLDPRFAPLHGDAQFGALLARIGVDPLAAMRSGPATAAAKGE